MERKDLLPLARAVTDSKSVTVPSYIIQAGLRAVSLRKKFTEWFQSKTGQQDQDIAQSNTQHSHFTGLIEEIIMILQPCFAESATKAAKVPDTDSETIEEITNRFASLEVEEPTEETGEPEYQSSNTSQERVVYDVEPPKTKQDIASEKIFSLYCLFDDLQKLRLFVAELWIELSVSDTTLIEAAIVTNAAFQLAIRTQDDILAQHPECADYQGNLSLPFLHSNRLNCAGRPEITYEINAEEV